MQLTGSKMTIGEFHLMIHFLIRCGPCRFTPPCKCNVSWRRVGINEQTALSNVFVKLKAPQLGDDVHSLARILARQKISDDAVALQKRNGEASPEVLFFSFLAETFGMDVTTRVAPAAWW